MVQIVLEICNNSDLCTCHSNVYYNYVFSVKISHCIEIVFIAHVKNVKRSLGQIYTLYISEIKYKCVI